MRWQRTLAASYVPDIPPEEDKATMSSSSSSEARQSTASMSSLMAPSPEVARIGLLGVMAKPSSDIPVEADKRVAVVVALLATTAAVAQTAQETRRASPSAAD